MPRKKKPVDPVTEALRKEWPYSQGDLNRHSGVSLITLRRYLIQNCDEIPSKALDGRERYNDSSVQAVKAIRARNLERYGGNGRSVEDVRREVGL